MAERIHIILDGVSSNSLGLVMTKRPSIPAPTPNYNSVEVNGIDGDYTEFLGTYKNYDVDIEFSYVTTPNNWHQIWRNVKRWLLTGEIRKLQFSDDIDYFKVVKKILLKTNERSFIKTGKFVATFTFAPYDYLVSGQLEYTPNEVLINEYDICKPIYIIVGEGVCTLNVNGNEMMANIGQNLTINTELKIAYRDNGIVENTAVTGDYCDMYLIPGENTISITDGFSLSVIPNWRSL